MGDPYITDAGDYPEFDEELERLPGPAINLILHLRSIVAWMTSRPVDEIEETNVFCRRSPGRRRCVGQIVARLHCDRDEIEWGCPECGDGGVISGWRNSSWNRGIAPSTDGPAFPGYPPSGGSSVTKT